MSPKIVMITGAGVGIGRAAALLFAERGDTLVLVDYNAESLEKLRSELRTEALCLPMDVSNEEAVRAGVERALALYGHIDILVNCAALWRFFAPIEETPSSLWQQYMNINVLGSVYCIQAVLPGMKQNRWGRIINIASVAGVYGNATMTAYSASKGALIALTKALAKETAEYGITVNATSPGSVSPSDRGDIDYVEPSQLSFSGRTGSDRENAELILFLAGDGAGYINGQNILIDGSRKKM